MITSLDIQNKEFKRAIRGYSESDVDRFLDDIVEDYESIYRENVELKDKVVALNEQIKQYNNLEDTLKETLIVAQGTADEMMMAARNKAQLILEEAEMTAKKIVSSAEDEVSNIRREYENLKKETIIFKTRYKSFIETQLITLDEFCSNIESQDINKDQKKNFEDNEENIDKHDDIDSDENIENWGA